MKKIVLFLLCLIGITEGITAMKPQCVTNITPGIYEHKSGKRYEVLGVARFSENPHQQFVVYKSLYESRLEPEGTILPIGSLWVRPLEMFVELVQDASGNLVPRFRKISEK